jgi:signal transduction histidine kinase
MAKNEFRRMKSICFTILSILLLCKSILAQHSKKDSLYQIVKLNKNDTGTIMALLDYGDIALGENATEPNKFYENALQKSKELKFWKGLVEAYNCLAFFYGVRMSDKENGTKYGQIYLNESIIKNDEFHIGRAYFIFAAIHQKVKAFDSSLIYYEKAIPFVQKTKPKNLRVIYNNMAGIYDDLHLTNKALEYVSKAMEMCKMEQDTGGIISGYIHLSNIYSWDKKFLANQVAAFQEGIRLAQSQNDNYALSIFYNNLSGCKHDDFEQYDSAVYYSKLALQFAGENSSNNDIVELKISLAKHYASANQFDNALQTFDEVIRDSSKLSLSLNKQLLLLETKFVCNRGLKQFKEATAVATKIFSMKDSIEAQNSRETALAFDERLQKANQAKLISEKELKITKQQSMLNIFSILGVSILLTSILLFLYFRKKQIAQQLKIKTVEKEKELHATKSNLEGQLHERSRISKEIHDELGSSLTSISLLTEVLKKRIDTHVNPEVNKISVASADMVDKMNEIIWALNTSNDTINSLIAYVRKFSNHFLEDAGIHLQFEEPLIPETMAIEGTVRRNIYLTIKEAINNIVKHAGAANVHLQVNMDNGLHINIQDDGKGIAFDTLPAFRNGLTNMKKRMEDIGGTLNIESTKGTLIKLFYPINTTA